MDFTTPVKLPLHHPTLGLHSRVMLIGSCFADHMGERLMDQLPEGQVMVNPNGVLYNPKSIHDALLEALTLPSEWQDSRCLFQSADGLWRHWGFSTKFTSESLKDLTTWLAAIRQDMHDRLQQLDLLALTFSTDGAYRLKQGRAQGMVVANCHKQPSTWFEEITLDGDALLEEWKVLLDHLFTLRPTLQVVLTLSPYRYAKCGMHLNALIKARLLLLMDALCRAFPDRVHYFPAYEIITDELRDYRFYATDMLHPSEQAVDYVWQRFREWCFSQQLAEYGTRKSAMARMLRHRLMTSSTSAREQWERKKSEKLLEFKEWERRLLAQP